MKALKDLIDQWAALPSRTLAIIHQADHIAGRVANVIRTLDDIKRYLLEIIPQKRLALVYGKGESVISKAYHIGKPHNAPMIDHEKIQLPIAFEPQWCEKGERVTLTLRTHVPLKLTELKTIEPFIIRSLRIGNRIQEPAYGGASLEVFAHDVLEPGCLAQCEVEWPKA